MSHYSVTRAWACNSYSTAHSRVANLWGSARQYPCVDCFQPSDHWAYDGTDPDDVYEQRKSKRPGGKPMLTWNAFSSWPEFYMPLCRKCHRTRDGAAAARDLTEYRLQKRLNRQRLREFEEKYPASIPVTLADADVS